MYHIALNFDLNENWIGGSYYIRNLVSALALLPEAEQPHISLISEHRKSVEFIEETCYEYLSWIKPEQFNNRPHDFPFDAIFPWASPDQNYRTISWIPDFQELHLPLYFSEAEIASRRHHHRLRFQTAGLVVSSEDVLGDVHRFYPGECPNVAVVRFATFDKFDESKVEEIRATYELKKPYIMCANQVWVHKNHITVIKALSLLRSKGLNVTICFTGNESDYRVAGYADFLRKMAQKWGVSENIRFLGFIPRSDQLCLMKGAQYIIQPSLFEGWSTVIEDAKSMQQFVVASDLRVHKEQLLSDNAHLFPRHDPEALASIMQNLQQTPPKVKQTVDYQERQRTFGRDMLIAFQRFSHGPRVREKGMSLADVSILSSENKAQN